MDFSKMSDEELLKPDRPNATRPSNLEQMSDEDLLKPDAQASAPDFSQMSDEDLLKPDAPDFSKMSDEELLKPDAAQEPEKKDIGIGGWMKAELAAKQGREVSGWDVVKNKLSLGIDDANENRKAYVEQRLAMMEEDNPIEMIKLAQSIGLDQAKIDEIMERADSGQRSAFGVKLNPKIDVMKQGFSKLAKPLMEARLKAREAAQQTMAEAKELGAVGKIVKGAADMGPTVVAYMNPVTAGIQTAGGIVNRLDNLQKDVYKLDENGNPVLVQSGDRSEAAAFKAVRGGLAEYLFWVVGVRKMLGIGGGALKSIPGIGKYLAAAGNAVKGAAGKAASPVAEKAAAAWKATTQKLGESAGGRVLLKTGELLGKIDDNLKVGSLPHMVVKSRLTEYLDEVVGLNARDGERESLGEWLDKVTSVENNADMLLGMIAVHVGMAALSAHGRARRKAAYNKELGRFKERVKAAYGEEKAKSFSDADYERMFKIVNSPNLTPESVTKLIDRITGEIDAQVADAKGRARMREEEAEAGEVERSSTIKSKAMDLLGKMDEGAVPVEDVAIGDVEGLEPSDTGKAIENYDPAKAKPIVVWEDLEGNRHAVTGGKRLAMAGASGEETVKAVVIKEADGWTEAEARSLGTTENLREGSGTLRNVVEAVDSIGADGVAELAGWHQANGSRDFAGTIRKGLAVAQKGGAELKTALAEGRIGEDFAYNAAQVLSMERVGEGWEAAQRELAGLVGKVGPEELEAVLWGLKKQLAEGTSAIKSGDFAAAIAEERAKYNARKGGGEGKLDSDQVLIETADGELKTLGEIESGMAEDTSAIKSGEGEATIAEAPELAAAEGAGANKAVELRPIQGRDGAFGTLSHPNARFTVDGEGKIVAVEGLTPEDFAPGRAEATAALVARIEAFAVDNGLRIGFRDEATRDAWARMRENIKAEGKEAYSRTQMEAKRNAVVDRLKQSGLATEVVQTKGDFDRLVTELNGRPLTAGEQVYGFCDVATGKVYLNPDFFATRQGLDAPIHEFGHLGIIAAEKVNKAVYDRGMKLAEDLLAEHSSASKSGETGVAEIVDFILNDEYYSKRSRQEQAEELLAQLIGKRGEAALRAETNKTVVNKIKAWLVEFWNTFGKALGLKDITPEQAAKMTVEQVADAIRAEMMSGRKYGEGLDRVEFGDGGARIATKPVRIKRKLTGRRKAVNEFVNRMGGADDPANVETDLLALWVDNGGRLFDAMPFQIETNYSSGKTGVKTTRRAVADEFAESTAFYQDLDPAQRKVFFGSEKLEMGPIGEGLKNKLKEAGITRFTNEDGTVDFDAVIDEFKRQWTNYERGEEVLKERNEWQEERDRAYVEEMERAERAAYDEISAEEAAARAEMEAADEASAAQIAADLAAGRFSRGGIRVSKQEYARISSLVAENEAKAAKAGADHPPTGIVRTSKGIYIYDYFSDATFSVSRALRNTPKNGKLFTAQRKAFDNEVNRTAASIAERLEKRRSGQGHGGDDIVGIRDGAEGRGDGELAGGVHQGLRPLPDSSAVHQGAGNNRPEDAAGRLRWSRSGIFTGTAADYANRSRKGGEDDGPSLVKVGTGEGSQVYGWGLYGSTERGVAEGYANQVSQYRKSKPEEKYAKYKGKIAYPKDVEEARDVALRLVGTYESVESAISYLKQTDRYSGAIVKEAIEWLEKNKQDITPPTKPSNHLYEQTFFTDRAPGDESHLLKWYDAISDANWDRVIAQAEKEGLREKLKGAWWLRFNGDLEHFITDNGNSGDAIYERLSKLLGGPQSASEFLARAGIDGVKYPVDSYGGKGVKNGDEVGWNYVSFRDDNIRVDHKWTDGQMRFSRFAGEKGAENMGVGNANHARSMESAGADREKIWRETGWWKGKDGKWRFELPNVERFKPVKMRLVDGTGYGATVGELIDAPHLFDAYPGIVDVPVVINSMMGSLGRVSGRNGKHIISLAPYAYTSAENGESILNAAGREAIVHEIQHVVQDLEGFAKGGSIATINEARDQNNKLSRNVGDMMRKSGYEKWMDGLVESGKLEEVSREAREKNGKTKFPMERAYAEQLGGEDGAFLIERLDRADEIYADNSKDAAYGQTAEEAYRSIAGEVEARNASRREAMTPEERAATPPWKTEDVPEDRQIVRFSRAKAVSDANGNESYKVESNGKMKRYKTPKEALEDFIKELDGQTLNEEQQGIYDVVTGVKNTADIRKNDLGELVKFHKGGRGKGAGKIIAVHYAGKRGKVTAKEVIDIGQVIRSGTLDYDGTAEHPYSHTYTATASDGAELKVVIDLDKKGNEAVINFYSDRKTGNGGQRPHPVSTTTSSSPQSIPNSGAGAQGGVKLSRGGKPPEAELVQTTRVADDAGQGEQTPGAIAASRELSRQGAVPLTTKGTRYVSLPLSEMHALARYLTGHAMPDEMQSGRKLGAAGKASLKHRKVIIAADMLGTIDKSDMAVEKEFLKQHGFFRHENANWCATHSPSEVRQERARSEDALSSRLEALSDRRVHGREPGGQMAATRVYADQLAKIVMAMPHGQPGVLGAMQTVAGALEKRVRGSEAEAEAFLDWMSGQPQASGRAPRSAQERKAEMFAAFLMMPKEMESRAKGWYDGIRSTIAADKKLAEAFRKMTARMMTEQGYGHLQAEIEKDISRQHEQAVEKLSREADESIKPKSRRAQIKEAVVLTFDDKGGAALVRIGERERMYLGAQRKLMKQAKTPQERALIKQQIDAYLGDMGQKLNTLALARAAWERGSGNADSVYDMKLCDALNEALVRDGLRFIDLSLYLDQQRVIESKGVSGSRGESARQAQIILDTMKKRLGADFAKVEAFAQKFHAIHEQEFLNSPALERVLGKRTLDAWRENIHYVTTKRQFSPEELKEIEAKRAELRKTGAFGGDDMVGDVYKYATRLDPTAGLRGSFASKREVMSATMEKTGAIMHWARKCNYVIELRDALLAAGVEGVHDMPAGTNELKSHKRYGTIRYVENGQKRTLVVPREIAKDFEQTSSYDNAAIRLLASCNNFARRMVIDYNLPYGLSNMWRNVGSAESNVPGMREAVIKRASRFVSPGVATAEEIAMQLLVRNLPEKWSLPLRKMWGEHTALYWLPQAKRIAMWLTDYNKMQRKFWEAEQRGDLGTLQQMEEDRRWAIMAKRANMFHSMTTGRIADPSMLDAQMQRGGMTLMSSERRERDAKPKWRRALDFVNIFQRNARQQVYEDVLIKTIMFLHDRAQFGKTHNRTLEESGLIARKYAGIPETERKGIATPGIQALFNPFWGAIEKGVMRHVDAIRERPKETLHKDAWRLSARITNGLLASGALAAYILYLNDGDEEKAKNGKLGAVYSYARGYQRAYQNCSNYVRNNYHITPLWTKGYTSIILGMPLTDEERILEPVASLISDAAAVAAGTKQSLHMQEHLLNLTKVIAPDFKMAGFGVTLFDDTLGTFLYEPEDYYTGGYKYDRDLYATRYESLSDFGQFSWAVAKRLWNDFGGRGILPTDRSGVDNGLGEEPGWVARAVNSIPIASPYARRMVKVQVGSPRRDAAEILEAERIRQAVIRKSARAMFKIAHDEKRDLSLDPVRYGEMLDKWQKAYGLTPDEMAQIEERYLNAWRAYEGAQFKADGEREKFRSKAEKLGLDAARIWLDWD